MINNAMYKSNNILVVKPSFMMVLTGVGQYAYKRPTDDVLVVPIGTLKN